MEIDSQDLSLKFRMTGALVWLLLLIIVVPGWYSHPVGFSPGMDIESSHQENDQIVVDKPFVLPNVKTEPADTHKKLVENAVAENKSADQKNVGVESVESKTPEKTSQKVADKPKLPTTTEKWVIRVAAYRSKEKANLLYEHLKYDYDVFVKYFPQSKYYSVRIGPYSDKSLAIKDQKELNRVLRVRSELAKTK